MPFYYTPWILLPLLSAIINSGLAVNTWRRRHVPAAIWLFWVTFGMAGWGISYILNTTATELWLKILFHTFGNTFTSLLLIVELPMILAFMKPTERIGRVKMTLLCLVPLAYLILAWTNVLHGLLRQNMYLVNRGGMLLMGYDDGPLVSYFFLYFYLYYFAAILLCIWFLIKRGQTKRLSLFLTIVATLVPLLTDMLGLAPVKEFRLTTSTICISGICYWLAVFRGYLLNLVPIARSALFDEMHQPVLVVDRAGRLAECNHAALKQLALPTHAIGLSMEQLFPPSHSLHALQGAEQKNIRHDLKHKRWWHVSQTALKQEDTVAGTMLVLHDVTEINEARTEQERFLSMISHEYRTPMAIIKANLDILDLKSTKSNFDLSSELTKMQRGVERMAELLDAARRREDLDVKSLRLERETIPLKTILDDIFAIAIDLWGERFTMRYAIAGDCPLNIDKKQIHTAILNLLDNAIKYSPPDVPVVLCADDGGTAVKLSVTNTTSAEVPVDLDKLIDKYARGTNSSGISGAGVGLYLVAGIMEQHGGSFRLENIGSHEIRATIIIPLNSAAC